MDAVVGTRRLAGWAVWLELLAIARLLTAWSARPPILDERIGLDPCADADPALAKRLRAVLSGVDVFLPTTEATDTSSFAADFVSSEIAAAAGISASAATGRVHAAAAIFLTDRLPRTRALLRAGLVDNTKLRTVLTGTAVVTDDAVCRSIEARLISDADVELALAAGGPDHVLDVLDPQTNPRGPGTALPWLSRVTNPALGRRIAALVTLFDKEAAARRAARARAERHVSAEALPDAMGRVSVTTGREAITAIVDDLDACAATAKAAGDERSPDQIRADELTYRMSLGAFGAPALPVTTPATAEQGDASGSQAVGVRAFRVSVTVPLSTWLSLADEPGVLDGYGPIPAALVRQIVAEAARDHPLTTTWRCVPVDDVHRTVLGVGDTFPTPRHDPPPRIRAMAQTADPTCVWPGCSRRAAACDLDHRVPFDHDDPAAGGPTCSCNLQPLCRKHHRLKGTGLIAAMPDPRAAASIRLAPHDEPTGAPSNHEDQREEQAQTPATPVGSLLWRSWTGRTYLYIPPPAAEAPLTAAERATVARAELWRRVGESAVLADADDPEVDDHRRDARARYRELAEALRPPTCAGEEPSPDGGTSAMQSWEYAITRTDRRARSVTTRGTDTATWTDECPF